MPVAKESCALKANHKKHCRTAASAEKERADAVARTRRWVSDPVNAQRAKVRQEENRKTPKYQGMLRRAHEAERTDPIKRAKRRGRDRTSDTTRRQANRNFVNEIKLRRGCADCGYNARAIALDFDHLPEFVKIDNVSKMILSDATLDAIQREIDKCEVVCANCHRIRTEDRRG